MIKEKKLIYKRILLKLSGEVLQGKKKFGIDPRALYRIVQEIKTLMQLKIEIGMVIGGGNLFRGARLAKSGMNPIVGDYIGMLATIMNGLAMRDTLYNANIKTNLMSMFSLNGICENYNWINAINLIKKYHVVIFSAGIGNPCFTTDSAACVRGIEINADIVLKATQVDGVYSEDPKCNPHAILYDKLTHQDVLNRELKIMDLVSIKLARDHELPICIFNITKPGALLRVVTGENEGTLIMNSLLKI